MINYPVVITFRHKYKFGDLTYYVTRKTAMNIHRHYIRFHSMTSRLPKDNILDFNCLTLKKEQAYSQLYLSNIDSIIYSLHTEQEI